MRVLLAMSGGIDSSVVAHLLREQGHDVVGARFALWSDPLAPSLAQILPSKCCNAQTASRARTVAEKLGIPLHIIDLSEEFKRVVVDRFLNDQRRGLTPNPCVACNREIKFGTFMEVADRFDCEVIATGHYARVVAEDHGNGEIVYKLLEAKDIEKDQSYYLHGLSQAQLKRVLFPLGDLPKTDVFRLAATYGVPFDEHYRESQDLCFFPEKTPTEFLKRHLQDAIRPGSIVKRSGDVVGQHDGLPLYTIGQRRGLRIGGLKIPLEVVAKDVPGNRLIVADRASEMITELLAIDPRWIGGAPPEDGETFTCRTRSLMPKCSGTYHVDPEGFRFRFDRPMPPQTPGQSIVLYRGEEIVGGGTIV